MKVYCINCVYYDENKWCENNYNDLIYICQKPDIKETVITPNHEVYYLCNSINRNYDNNCVYYKKIKEKVIGSLSIAEDKAGKGALS